METPLPALISAAMRGDAATAKELLATCPAEALLERDGVGKTALHWACYYDEVELVHLLLANPAVDVNARGKHGQTALHDAAVSGSLRAIDALLSNLNPKNETDRDAQNMWGETALHLAAASGKTDSVRALLAKGVSQGLVDIWGRTPEQVAKENGYHNTAACFTSQTIEVSNEPSQPQPKQAASPAGKRPMPLSKLLEYPGNEEEVKKWLSDPNIDPAGTDMFKWPALHKVCSWNRPTLVSLLLAKLDTKSMNSRGGPDSQTPLHCCIEMGAKHALEILLEDGRSHTGIKDANGHTASELAVLSGQPELAEMIQAHESKGAPPLRTPQPTHRKSSAEAKLEDYTRPVVVGKEGWVSEVKENMGVVIGTGIARLAEDRNKQN